MKCLLFQPGLPNDRGSSLYRVDSNRRRAILKKKLFSIRLALLLRPATARANACWLRQQSALAQQLQWSTLVVQGFARLPSTDSKHNYPKRAEDASPQSATSEKPFQ